MRIENPQILEALPGLGVEIRPGTVLSTMTSLGIGGPTDLLLVRQHKNLPELIRLLEQEGIPHKFLGGGSNLLVADCELPWVMLQLRAPELDVVIEGSQAFIHCAAGRQAQCREEFRRALEIDPQLELTPAEAGHPGWGPVFRSVKAARR